MPNEGGNNDPALKNYIKTEITLKEAFCKVFESDIEKNLVVISSKNMWMCYDCAFDLSETYFLLKKFKSRTIIRSDVSTVLNPPRPPTLEDFFKEFQKFSGVALNQQKPEWPIRAPAKSPPIVLQNANRNATFHQGGTGTVKPIFKISKDVKFKAKRPKAENISDSWEIPTSGYDTQLSNPHFHGENGLHGLLQNEGQHEEQDNDGRTLIASSDANNEEITGNASHSDSDVELTSDILMTIDTG